MLHKCNDCNRFNRVKANFWISKIDAFGFLILSILLTGPVWFMALLVEEFQGFAYFIAILTLVITFINKEYKVVAILLFELIIDSLLYESGMFSFSFMITTAFIITFYKIGRKVYGFFFMCVNYKLSLDLFCKHCGQVSKAVKLPSE